MYYGLTTGQHSCLVIKAIGALSTQTCNPTLGGGMDQGPATEVTHLRLNQPPVALEKLEVGFNSCSLVLRPGPKIGERAWSHSQNSCICCVNTRSRGISRKKVICYQLEFGK